MLENSNVPFEHEKGAITKSSPAANNTGQQSLHNRQALSGASHLKKRRAVVDQVQRCEALCAEQSADGIRSALLPARSVRQQRLASAASEASRTERRCWA